MGSFTHYIYVPSGKTYVFDGTDAVMLSGETTTGKYPTEAVRYMAEIVENTEKYLDYENIVKPDYEADIIADNALEAIKTILKKEK